MRDDHEYVEHRSGVRAEPTWAATVPASRIRADPVLTAPAPGDTGGPARVRHVGLSRARPAIDRGDRSATKGRNRSVRLLVPSTTGHPRASGMRGREQRGGCVAVPRALRARRDRERAVLSLLPGLRPRQSPRLSRVNPGGLAEAAMRSLWFGASSGNSSSAGSGRVTPSRSPPVRMVGVGLEV